MIVLVLPSDTQKRIDGHYTQVLILFMTKFNTRRNPYILLILATLFWAGNFVLGKSIITRVPPITLAFVRWGLAFIILLPFAYAHVRKDWSAIVRSWKILLPVSLLGITCFNTMIYVGLQSTTAINSLLLQSFFPVVVAALAFVFFREKLSRTQILGIFVSLCGTLWLVSHGNLDQLRSATFNQGDLWVFSAVVIYAVYALLLRFRPAIHPLSFLAVTFGLGILMLLPLFLEEIRRVPLILNSNTVLTFSYLALFPSLIAYLFFNEAVDMIGATTAGLFSHLVPTFGSLMAIVFLGEQFYAYHAWGILLIFSGILLVVKQGLSRRTDQPKR